MNVIDGNCLNVKIFSSIYKENLEEEINTFLKEKNEDNDYTYTKEIYDIQYTYNGGFSAITFIIHPPRFSSLNHILLFYTHIQN